MPIIEFLIACLISAVDYIHSKGVIHKDIKPENLIFDPKGYLLLNDFGLSMYKGEQLKSESSGTLEYLPPEAIQINTDDNHIENMELNPTYDYYSIGIILYELMLGYRPYHWKNSQELLERKLKKQIAVIPSQIPKGWNSIVCSLINGLLMINPKERLGYSNGLSEIMFHPWFKDFDWNKLKRHQLFSPFIPIDTADNYNKAYCQSDELIGTETMQRYQEYIKDPSYDHLFDFFISINQHVYQKYSIEKQKLKHKRLIRNTMNNIAISRSYGSDHLNVSHSYQRRFNLNNPSIKQKEIVELPLLKKSNKVNSRYIHTQQTQNTRNNNNAFKQMIKCSSVEYKKTNKNDNNNALQRKLRNRVNIDDDDYYSNCKCQVNVISFEANRLGNNNYYNHNQKYVLNSKQSIIENFKKKMVIKLIR